MTLVQLSCNQADEPCDIILKGSKGLVALDLWFHLRDWTRLVEWMQCEETRHEPPQQLQKILAGLSLMILALSR